MHVRAAGGRKHKVYFYGREEVRQDNSNKYVKGDDMAKKKKRNKKTIKTEAMLSLLKQINLGGVVEECSIDIKKGKGHIEVVDITDSMVIIADKNIASKGVTCNLGFGNLELLISFLSTIEDSKIHMNYKTGDEILTLQRTDGRRKLNYLLSLVELIATNLSMEEDDDEDEDAYQQMKDLMEYSVDLTPTLIKDFLKYISILKSKETTIYFDSEEETITFKLGNKDDHQFELVLSEEVESENDDSNEFEMVINGEHLAKVFATIIYDDEDPPKLSFSEENPIMIETEGISWSLKQLAEFEDEGE